jgi:hypothetical protein
MQKTSFFYTSIAVILIVGAVVFASRRESPRPAKGTSRELIKTKSKDIAQIAPDKPTVDASGNVTLTMVYNQSLPIATAGATFFYNGGLCFTLSSGQCLALSQGNNFSLGDIIAAPDPAQCTRPSASFSIAANSGTLSIGLDGSITPSVLTDAPAFNVKGSIFAYKGLLCCVASDGKAYELYGNSLGISVILTANVTLCSTALTLGI